MVAHILFPGVDDTPSSLSGLWIRDVLRGELGFQGVVFADDLSMKGAAAYGDIVSRSRQALAAGCDMLPVCNHRPSVIELLDKLDCEPQPASSLRLVRLHGRTGAPDRGSLEGLPEWTRARELLARVSAPPTLTLDPGGTPA
jgi:beta-N-acetylhexosaminidase